jgi:hypothetical protein
MGLPIVTQCIAPDYRGSTNGPYDLEVSARQLRPEVMVFTVYDLADCTSGADAYLYFEVRIPPQILGLQHLFAPIDIGMHPRPGCRRLERCSEGIGEVCSTVHCGNRSEVGS